MSPIFKFKFMGSLMVSMTIVKFDRKYRTQCGGYGMKN